MHKFVFLTRLALGAFCLAVLASAPIFFASAQEGQEHEMISGVVQKVDATAGKITLKHRPIKSLGMEEGLTMVFAVQDPGILKGLKAGDKVRFEPDGQLTVTKIQKTN